VTSPVVIGDATLYLGNALDILPLIRADVAIADPVYGVASARPSSLRKDRTDKAGYETDAFEDTPEYVRYVMVPAAMLAVERFGRAAITPGAKNMWLYPKPSHMGTFQYPGSTVMSAWGPMMWQAILFYGKDPHQGRLVPDSITNCNDFAVGIDHPCPKPLRSWTKLVERASLRGETVCDYVMGSGTTGVSCMELGRKFVGIELVPKYFDIACRRIEQAYAQRPLFEAEPARKPEQLGLEASDAA
jgi:site-specific DNA-methyltransferase (adenine-specific)